MTEINNIKFRLNTIYNGIGTYIIYNDIDCSGDIILSGTTNIVNGTSLININESLTLNENISIKFIDTEGCDICENYNISTFECTPFSGSAVFNQVIECNEQAQYSGGEVYPKEITYNLGNTTGTVTLTYQAFGLPDRFIVEYNNNIVIDTGYRGNAVYDFGGSSRTGFTSSLTGRIDPITGNSYPDMITYPDDGYPRITTPGNGTATFEKDSGNVVRVYVYGPQSGTAWNVNISCPE